MRIDVIVSFDLHRKGEDVSDSIYRKIKTDLAAIKVEKIAATRDGRVVRLPANTFVGILSGELAEERSRNVRDVVRKKVVSIVKKHHKRATVFVFVGKKWAWTRKSFRN